MDDPSTIEQFINWLTTSGIRIVIILVATKFIIQFVNLFITRAIRRAVVPDNFATEAEEKKREDTIISILIATGRVIIWSISAMIVVSELGIDIGPMIAGLSVIGVGISFGAQDLIKDFIAGTFIILENQYRVGDVVEINGVSGVVEEFTMRLTILRDLDGNVHNVRNGTIDLSTNMSIQYSNINLDIGVGYDTDIDKLEEIINKVGKDITKDKELGSMIIETPHFERIDDFADSSIVVKILGKVKAGKQWQVTGEIRRQLKKEFEKNKIEIPFPQLVVHKDK